MHPYPVFDASVVIVICDTSWLIGLNAVSMDSIHHRISLIASGDRDMGLSKLPLDLAGPAFYPFQSSENVEALTLHPENWM